MSNNFDSGNATFYPPNMYGNANTIVGPGVGTKTPGTYGFDTVANMPYTIDVSGVLKYTTPSLGGYSVGRDSLVGIAGVVEQPAKMVTITDTLRIYRKTNGIAENGAVVSIIGNSPGNTPPRAQVVGILNPSGLSWYPDRDGVTLFVEADQPIPAFTAACTFTAFNVTLPAGTDTSTVLPGMVINTNHSPKIYSGFVTAVIGLTITVEGWYLLDISVYSATNPAPRSTPPNSGAGVWINPVTRAWGINANLVIPTGVPNPSGVIAEFGFLNNSSFSTQANGIDLVSIGLFGPAASFLARGTSRANTHYMALGAISENFKSDNTVGGLGPSAGFSEVSAAYVGFYSLGTIGKTFHARFMDNTGAVEKFSVDLGGNVTVAGAIIVLNAPIEMTYMDMHSSPTASGYAARLTVTAAGKMQITPNGGVTSDIPIKAAALTAAVPAAAAAATPTKPEFDAVVARLADLEAKLRTALALS